MSGVETKPTPNCGKSKFYEWASLHNLETPALLEFLSGSHRVPSVNSAEQSSVGIHFGNSESARSLVKAAFLSKLPEFSAEIECVFKDTLYTSASTSTRLKPPFFWGKATGQSQICVDFDGTARAMLDLAHEYGHALEFHISGRSLIPPVYREFLAFVCETILLDYLTSTYPERAEALRTVILDDDKTYLVDDFSSLATALRSKDVEYNYRWNYPVARYLLIWIRQNFEKKELGHLFRESRQLQKFLPIDEILHLSTSRNYLPKMLPLDERSSQSAYAKLGAMALLDIDYWDGHSNSPIVEYFEDLQKHLATDTSFLLSDIAGRPIGYATWNIASNKTNYVLNRQSAPFGDHLTLQKTLAKHLGGKCVHSENQRSSRKEQLAWQI